MIENAMSLRSSVSDFIQIFENNLPHYRTNKGAYEAAEARHEQVTGNRRYSDYDSFRRVRGRRFKKRKR